MLQDLQIAHIIKITIFGGGIKSGKLFSKCFTAFGGKVGG
jgi:hypothetical protein